MVTRADKFTQSAQQEIFSDFLNSFGVHPITGALGKTTNANAVKQSIRNLIFTNYGERFFQPQVGGDVYRSLFEPITSLTSKNIVDSITKTINYNEPRAKLLGVNVYNGTDENTVVVLVVFSLINNSTPISLDVTLTRVR